MSALFFDLYNRNIVTKITLIFLAFSLYLTLPATAHWRTLPVLVYHHIQPKPSSDVSCTPKQFSAQMQAILKAGYTPLNLEQIRSYLLCGKPNIILPIAITFDDGYESLYKYAFPVAKKLHIPMIIFLITSRIGKKPQFTRYLSATQIREMSDSGFIEFGSHSHDLHTDILRIFNAFKKIKPADNPVKNLIDNDLQLSYRTLKIITGKKPIAIAWPYGKYNGTVTQIAKKIGFKLHFTSKYGFNEIGDNPYAIKRIPVSARDNVKSLMKKLTGR